MSDLPNTPAPQNSASPATDALAPLRDEIDRIDDQLVSLLAARKRVVQQVADVKRQRDLPTHHPAREENLISLRRKQAAQAGLDPDYIEDLFRTVLRHSRVGQLTTLSRRSVRPGAKILIVGGRGSMGTFLTRWFTSSDYEVRILDREDWPQAAALAKDVDVALLAVPIDSTPAIARQIAPFLPPKCVFCDITSLKREPVAAMLESHPGPVMGLHPLFGPSTTTMDKQIVVTTPGRDPQAAQWILDQLSVWGNVLVETTADEHDDIMGVVQSLRHFATFAFGKFLHSRRTPISRTLELSSPIYRLELGMVGRLFAQDPVLYAEIVFATPERKAMLRDYIQAMNQLLPLVERSDKAEFIAQFNKVADWFGPFSEQAMRESTFLIEKLVHRF